MAKYIIVSGSTSVEDGSQEIFYIMDRQSLDLMGMNVATGMAKAFDWKEDAEYVATTMEEENKSFDEAISDLEKSFAESDMYDYETELAKLDAGILRAQLEARLETDGKIADLEADYEAALKEAHQEFDLILSAIDAEAKVNPLLAQLLAPRYPFDPIPNDDSGWDEPLLV